MPRHAAVALSPVEATAEPIPAGPAPSGLSPHEEARQTLAAMIAADAQRRTDIAANEAATARADDVLNEALNDEGLAARTLTGVKAQSLMGGGFDWRESPSVIEAQATVQDAQERAQLARGVLDDLKAQREELDRAASWSAYKMQGAVSAVVTTYPGVATFVAEAIERRRAWHEAQQILDVLANHFGPPFRVPGFSNIEHFGAQPRAVALRETITRLQGDADAQFPV